MTPQETIRLGPLFATVFVVACGTEPAGRGQDPEGSFHRPDPVYARYERALALVERALSGTAGPDALRAAGGLVIEAAGTKNAGAEYQGFHPDSLSPGAFRETLAFSPDGERIGHQYRHDRFDGTREAIREVYGPGDRRVIFILEQGFAVHLASPEHESGRRRLARRLPGLLLAEARERRAGLRHLGRSEGLEIVSAVLRDGRTVNLGFDPETGLLRRATYLQDAPGFGDVVARWRFDDYREVGGLGEVPHSYGVALNGRPFTRMEVSRIRTGGDAVRDVLDPPPGIEVPEPQEIPAGADASARAEVREVAPGVYMAVRLRTGFHPMFVEFEDFVVAVDAPAGYPLWDELPASDVAPGPTSDWLTERFIALIHETVPDKPVRYAVITHFHNDHAGGARAFVAEGATLLVPPSAEVPVRRLVAAPHTLAPDRLVRTGGTPTASPWIQVVEGRHEVSDGRRTLEVLDVGANPHTAHMLVARLPEEGIWFVSDLLDPARVESFPKPDHEALDRWFAGWLAREGYVPERIHTMHGTGLVTREHLAKLGFQVPWKGPTTALTPGKTSRIEERIDQDLLIPAWEGVDDPIERIFALLAAYRNALVATEFTYGCPIGGLALELREPAESVPTEDRRQLRCLALGRTRVFARGGGSVPCRHRPGATPHGRADRDGGGAMQARTFRAIEPFDASVDFLSEHLGLLEQAV